MTYQGELYALAGVGRARLWSDFNKAIAAVKRYRRKLKKDPSYDFSI